MAFDTWSPFFDVQKTLDEMDRILDAVGQPLGLRSVPPGTFPAINVYDQGNSAVLTAEIPGAKAKDLELTIIGDSVTLKGQRRDEPAENERYDRKERPSPKNPGFPSIARRAWEIITGSSRCPRGWMPTASRRR